MTLDQLGYFVYLDELENNMYYPDVEDSDPAYCAHHYHKRAAYDESDFEDRYNEDDEYGLYDTTTYDW